VFGSKGDGDVIVLLRTAGADPHKQNASGRTPLQMARLIGNYEEVIGERGGGGRCGDPGVRSRAAG
jgi:hypothetical protein